MSKLSRCLLLLVLVACGVSACGGDGGGGTIRKTTLTAAGWGPKSIAAEPGDPIIFTNSQLRAQVISTSPPGLFDSGILNMGGSFEWKVPKDTMYTIIRFEDALQHADGSINITLMPPK